MRRVARITKPVLDDYQRAMLYAADGGAYLFLYTRLEDGPCDSDYWYYSVEDAEREAAGEFGIGAQDWTPIDDPPPGAQHDWIRPTRVKTDSAGNKLRGQFEPILAAG
jgi:hypothetical protein